LSIETQIEADGTKKVRAGTTNVFQERTVLKWEGGRTPGFKVSEFQGFKVKPFLDR
jgi:hypothetical protein